MSTTYVKLGTSYRIPHVYCRPKLDGSNRNAGCSALLLPTEIRYTVSHRRGFPMSVTDENSIHSIALRGVPILLPTKIRYTVSRCRGFPCLLATEIRYTVIGMQGVLNFYTVSHRRGFPISVADTPYRIAEGSHVYY